MLLILNPDQVWMHCLCGYWNWQEQGWSISYAGLWHHFQVTSPCLHKCKQQTIRAADALRTLCCLEKQWRVKRQLTERGQCPALAMTNIFQKVIFTKNQQHHGYLITLKLVYMSHIEFTSALFLAKNRNRTYIWHLANHSRHISTQTQWKNMFCRIIQYNFIVNQGWHFSLTTPAIKN